MGNKFQKWFPLLASSIGTIGDSITRPATGTIGNRTTTRQEVHEVSHSTFLNPGVYFFLILMDTQDSHILGALSELGETFTLVALCVALSVSA